MSEQLTLLQRLKQARIVQVSIVFMGVSWVVLQAVGTLKDLLVLPDWIGPVTVILLGVGFVVVTATAWVQSLDATTKAEEAGEVPTDWQVAPADAVASLMSGELPHLTWGRAILGGVVAISLAIGAAGGYVLVTGGGGLIGPTEAGASGVAQGIAVLPFDTRGEDLSVYREGMVDLLSARFDGVGGYRTIDSRTVFARWAEEVGDVTNPDLDAALRAAGRTGARYAILGSMVPAGSQIRLAVDIYDVGDGSHIGSARVDGSPEEILGLVDGLSVGIARELLGAAGETAASASTLASITTNNVEALTEFLEGERLFRMGDFFAAVEAYERAVATDSTFALAWAQLAAVAGWTNSPAGPEARRTALRFADRLAPRARTLNTARVRYNEGDAEAIELFEEYTQRYPDDADAWYQLGDSYFHMGQGGTFASTRDQALEALRRAAELDPTFAPYEIHLVDFAFAAGDSAAAATAIADYRGNGGASNAFSERWDAGMGILFGDEAAQAAGIATALDVGQPELALGLLGSSAGVDNVPRELRLRRAIYEADSSPRTNNELLGALRRAGRVEESLRLLEQASPADAAWARMNWRLEYGIGDAEQTHRDAMALECDADPMDCLAVLNFKATHGAVDGHPEERAAAEARQPEALEAVTEMELPSEVRSFFDRIFASFDEIQLANILLWSGDAQGAHDIFSAIDGPILDHSAAAQAADEIGDFETAERYYLASDWQGGAYPTYRLAKMYERLGREEDALVQYRRLGMMWAEADADFEPWIEVQEALSRLGG